LPAAISVRMLALMVFCEDLVLRDMFFVLS
jgi:hypothetical protein